MKVKCLKPSTNMGGIRVKTPTGEIGYWASQWQKGVWLSANEKGSGTITPIFVEDLREALEWEITEEPVNVPS